MCIFRSNTEQEVGHRTGGGSSNDFEDDNDANVYDMENDYNAGNRIITSSSSSSSSSSASAAARPIVPVPKKHNGLLTTFAKKN